MQSLLLVISSDMYFVEPIHSSSGGRRPHTQTDSYRPGGRSLESLLVMLEIH